MLNGYHAAAMFCKHINHLAYDGRVREDDVVRQEDGKRFVADFVFCHQHGMPQSELLVLIYETRLYHRGYFAHLIQQFGIAARLQRPLQRGDALEVVVGCLLSARYDEHDVFYARLRRLAHGELDGGFVQHGQHHLRHSARHRQKARAKTRRRYYRFSDVHHAPFCCCLTLI